MRIANLGILVLPDGWSELEEVHSLLQENMLQRVYFLCPKRFNAVKYVFTAQRNVKNPWKPCKDQSDNDFTRGKERQNNT